MLADALIPDWPAPSRVHALQTLRSGGLSPAPYHSLNLGDHVGDDPACVQANRLRVQAAMPSTPHWLQQVHGIDVAVLGKEGGLPTADAVVTREPGRVCVVMTADCLPVLLCDVHGQVVAAAHAGWRGLCSGVIEATISAMQCEPGSLLAWLGPAIGPTAFEVGDEVRQAFMQMDAQAESAFLPVRPGKWMADIYALARQRLRRAGVSAIYGGGDCTYANSSRYFSYRRDGTTGRMGTFIWLDGV